MYLDHFKLDKLPFSLAPDTNFYCDLPTHTRILNRLIASLQQGQEVIKIIGKKGVGKTLLCQLLINELNNSFIIMLLPMLVENELQLYEALAHQLDINIDSDFSGSLDNAITQRLFELNKSDKHPVLIIDDTHNFSDDCLEAISRLTNLKIVMFGQPRLNKKLKKSALRQLKQRIKLSCYLKTLNKKEMSNYLYQRLIQAGSNYESIFLPPVKKHLIRASGGIPRLLNVLGHKALLISYSRGINQVDTLAMKRAINDTESVLPTRHLNSANVILALTTTVCLTIILFVYRKAGLL